MPISADQWRVVIGCNNVRRHRQIDLKQFCLEKMILGGSSIQLDLSDLSQLDAVVQEVRKDAETSHSATLNDFILDDSLDELSMILMTVCCHILCVEVLQCFLSMVKLQLLQLAGDVETNPGPETPEYRTMVSCIKELTDTTARGVSGISDVLFARSLMSDEIHRKMMDTYLEDHKKASILIKDVSGQIKLNPEKFLVFVDVLKEDGPWTNDIVSHVLKEYNSIKASAPPPSHTSTLSHSADVSSRVSDVDKIARLHRVDLIVLDQQCTDSRILPISKCIVPWNAYGRYLGLSPQQIRAIDTDRLLSLPHSKAEEMLLQWKKMCHAQTAMKCTYRYLLQGCISVEGNLRLVGEICDIIADPSYDKAGSDHVVPGICPSPYKQADKPQPVKADEPSLERARETEPKPSKEDELPNDVPKAFCELPPTTVKTQYSEESDARARAQVATGKLWPINHGKDVLRFYIINPDDLARVGLNADNIKSWAEKWDQHTYSNEIPKLRPSGHSNSDIRIKINPNGESWSAVGVDAELVDKSKPTMVLGFVKGRSDYNQHIAIHEFGHALGMEHEHQRSIFWSVAKKFIDVDKMKKDERLKNTDIHYLESLQCGDGSDKYDPDSVMHYWFDKEWLKSAEHRDKNKVNSDRILSDEERKVILGIHTRDNILAVCPSPTDFSFLAGCYRKKIDPIGRDQNGTLHRSGDQQENIQPQLIVPPPSTNQATGFPSLQRDMISKGRARSPSLDLNMSSCHAKIGKSTVATEIGSVINRVSDLATKIGKTDARDQLQEVSLNLGSSVTKVGVIGASNSGKSTTLNALIGDKFLPASSGGTTAHILCIKHNPEFLNGKLLDPEERELAKERRSIFEELKRVNKTQRKSSQELKRVNKIQRKSSQLSTASDSGAIFELQVLIPFLSKHPDINLELYDTPGTSEGKQSQIYLDTIQTIEQMEGLLLILSQDTVLLDPTTQLVQNLREKYPLLMDPKQPRILVLVNKYDLFFDDIDEDEDNETIEEKRLDISGRTGFPLQNIVFYSAKLALTARKWRADIASVDETQFDETKVAVRKLKKEEVTELLKKTDLTFEQKIKKMSDIATSGSLIEEVEKSIVKSCSMFKPLKAIDDTLNIICKLLEDVQQERERKRSDSEKQEAAGWSEDLEQLKLKLKSFSNDF